MAHCTPLRSHGVTPLSTLLVPDKFNKFDFQLIHPLSPLILVLEDSYALDPIKRRAFILPAHTVEFS